MENTPMMDEAQECLGVESICDWLLEQKEAGMTNAQTAEALAFVGITQRKGKNKGKPLRPETLWSWRDKCAISSETTYRRGV